MLSGFVFDLDGVIIDTAKLHFQAWRHELKKININYTAAENVAFKGMPRLATLEAILKKHHLTGTINEGTKNAIATAKNNYYKHLLVTSITKADILPGITVFLKAAQQEKIPLALASSSRNAPFILKQINLDKIFDYIVDPQLVANGKPAPDIYLQACAGIKVKPNEAVGFEDAIAGVIGLVAAGLKTVAITNGDKGEWNVADLVLNSTSELSLPQIRNLFLN